MSITQKRKGGVVAVFAAALALFAILASSSEAHAARSGGSKKPTIVLVHGAWADASGYDAVIENLQKKGYPVVAPANPLRGVKTDSAYLKSVLRTIKGPIVLVGHSYGGFVITDAATGDKQVKALVYIDALPPKRAKPRPKSRKSIPAARPADRTSKRARLRAVSPTSTSPRRPSTKSSAPTSRPSGRR